MKVDDQTQQGQAILEFALSIFVATLGITFSIFLVRAEWRRCKCAFLVFESAHTHLIHAELTLEIQTAITLGKIRIEETKDFVKAMGHCGQVTEQVILPKLESASWN